MFQLVLTLFVPHLLQHGEPLVGCVELGAEPLLPLLRLHLRPAPLLRPPLPRRLRLRLPPLLQLVPPLRRVTLQSVDKVID